jgi:hypothetical protein
MENNKNERWALRAWYYQSSSDAEKEGKRHRCRGTLASASGKQGNERGDQEVETRMRALYEKALCLLINNQPYTSIADCQIRFVHLLPHVHCQRRYVSNFILVQIHPTLRPLL